MKVKFLSHESQVSVCPCKHLILPHMKKISNRLIIFLVKIAKLNSGKKIEVVKAKPN